MVVPPPDKGMRLRKIAVSTQWRIFDQPRSAVIYNFGCLSVCLSLRHNFRNSGHSKFIFAHAVYLHGIRVKFVYEGHRVKVKVTGAKNVEKSYSRNVKLRSAINYVLCNTEPRILHAAWCFSLWRIEFCDHHLCHVTGSEHVCMHSRVHTALD